MKTVLDIIKNCNNMYHVSDNEIKFDSIHSHKRWMLHDWMDIALCDKIWVNRLPSLSHPPLSMRRHRVTRLPPKTASGRSGCPGKWWPAIIVWQVRYIQYLLACQKSQRSRPYNMFKSGLTWSQVFRRGHLGGRVTAVIRIRWPTVVMLNWAPCLSGGTIAILVRQYVDIEQCLAFPLELLLY